MLTLTQRARRAAITGKVIDAVTLRAVPGASALITGMPASFQKQLASKALAYGAAWADLTERPDLTSTADDGGFSFADLPDGAYTVTFSLPGTAYGAASQAFTVARDGSGAIPLNMQIVHLPPTAIKGLVLGGATPAQAVPLPMARVRVRGSGEVAFGDVNGRFYLAGPEPGPRTIDITAFGYQPATRPAVVAAGQVKDVGTIVLST